MLKEILQQLESYYEDMVAIRRDFHMYPELSFEEVRTPRKIAEYLESYGIKVRQNVGGNGVVGFLGGNRPGKTIALRADFDGLPIQDEKDVPYKSKIDGVMHACGHDIHTAALLGVARTLSHYRDSLCGNVVFVHQFAEEKGTGGAKPMIEDRCLDGVDNVYGAHVWATDPIGMIGIRAEYTMSSIDGFEIDIIGQGGHGAEPHNSIDPVVIGSELVLNLQQIASRKTDPQHSIVVTVGSFQSGKAGGVIPNTAKLTGTVRTYRSEDRVTVEKEIRRRAKHISASGDATCNIQYTHGYPSLWNDPQETARVEDIATQLFGTNYVHTVNQLMVSEDFAYYIQEIPGSFFFVGGRNPEINAVHPHHHPKFDVDERSMINIGKMFLGLLARQEVIPEQP